jgi:hypothetical protein
MMKGYPFIFVVILFLTVMNVQILNVPNAIIIIIFSKIIGYNALMIKIYQNIIQKIMVYHIIHVTKQLNIVIYVIIIKHIVVNVRGLTGIISKEITEIYVEMI